MTTTHELSPIELLVLSRLLVGGEKGVTINALNKDVGAFLEHRLGGSAAAEQIAQSLDDLAGRGLAELNRTKAGAISKAFATDKGKRGALDELGIGTLPPRLTWDALKKGHLSARALGLSAPRGEVLKAFKTANGYKAALLRKARDLPTDGEFPTKKKAEDALFWQLLGIPSSKEFSANNIKNALLGRELGVTVAKPDQGVGLLLARSVGARRADGKELIDAPIRSWVDGDAAPSARAAGAPAAPSSSAEGDRPLFDVDMIVEQPTATVPPPARPPLPLDEFARRVKAAARECPTGRFGENRVFISHVYRAMAGDPDINGMDPDTFKHRLVEANNARKLDLGRADLVPAMDRQDVGDSEVKYLGDKYHFVRI